MILSAEEPPRTYTLLPASAICALRLRVARCMLHLQPISGRRTCTCTCPCTCKLPFGFWRMEKPCRPQRVLPSPPRAPCTLFPSFVLLISKCQSACQQPGKAALFSLAVCFVDRRETPVSACLLCWFSPNAIALKGDPVRPQVSSSSPAIQFGRMGEKRVRRYVRNTDGRAKLKEDYVYVRGSICLP